MRIEQRTIRGYESLSPDDKQKLAELGNLLRKGEMHLKLRRLLAEIVGPLAVRERWELLEEFELKNIRGSIPLEGAAEIVAYSILDNCTKFGYPVNIRLVLEILSRSEEVDDELSSQLNPYFSRFVQNQE